VTTYFDAPGPHNTAETLRLAVTRTHQLDIKHIVVATCSGRTAQQLLDCGRQVIAVTHHVGFSAPGVDEMPAQVRAQLQENGVRVLTTTHLFGNVERGICNRFGGVMAGGIISATLRMFGQGVKVCFEIATMALDAGLIPYGEEVVAIGGTGQGADTAVVIKPAHGNDFLATELLELICKPRRP
jgi:hypothetical protein